MDNRVFSFSFIIKALLAVLPFLHVTLLIMAGTVFFSSILGFLLAAGMLSRKRALNYISSAYVFVMRCAPSIVLLFIVFYGLPLLLKSFFDINILFASKTLYVITALSLLYSASVATIMKSAFLAVPEGQFEAGLSIGFTSFQAFRRVVLPQAFIYALPNFANSLVSLLKEGALAYSIGLVDMMGAGMGLIQRNYGAYSLETYISLGLVYYLLTFIISRTFGFLERRLSRGVLS